MFARIKNRDLVRVAIDEAVDDYGLDESNPDRIFTAAGFGAAFRVLCGMKTGIDGEYVKGILAGRSDVESLRGRSHFRVVRTPVLATLMKVLIVVFAVFGFLVAAAFSYVCMQIELYG